MSNNYLMDEIRSFPSGDEIQQAEEMLMGMKDREPMTEAEKAAYKDLKDRVDAKGVEWRGHGKTVLSDYERQRLSELKASTEANRKRLQAQGKLPQDPEPSAPDIDSIIDDML